MQVYRPDHAGIVQVAVTKQADIVPFPVFVRSKLDTGTTAGEWFTLKPDAEIAGDQGVDDEKSYTLETETFTQAQEYLGLPEIEMTLRSQAPVANLIIRLVDVHPDGKATRISFGVLNLAHRNGNEFPQALPINEDVWMHAVIVFKQDIACGLQFLPLIGRWYYQIRTMRVLLSIAVPLRYPCHYWDNMNVSRLNNQIILTRSRNIRRALDLPG
jgi:hypothetical protein